jgi:hypothetical protein
LSRESTSAWWQRRRDLARGRGAVERDLDKRYPTRAEVTARWAWLPLAALGVEARRPMRRALDHLDETAFARALGEGRVGRTDVIRAWATGCAEGARPDRVLAAADLVAPDLVAGRRRPAVVVRDDAGTGTLGSRPLDPDALVRWCAGRAALGRYLDAGHRLSHVADPRGASAATWLARARLEVELSRLELSPRLAGRGVALGRGLS